MITPQEAREKAILAHTELLANWLRILCGAINEDMSSENLRHIVEFIEPKMNRVERNVEKLLRASGERLDIIE